MFTPLLFPGLHFQLKSYFEVYIGKSLSLAHEELFYSLECFSLAALLYWFAQLVGSTQKQEAKQVGSEEETMNGQPFALGKPPHETRSERERRLAFETKWNRKQERRNRVVEVVPKRPAWRILPSSVCRGFEFWIDTLKGDTFLTKRASLLDQIAHLQDPPQCPWKFPVGKPRLCEDIQGKGGQVLILLRMNQDLRWKLKRFFTLCRIRAMTLVNDKDPITMEPIEQPISIPFFHQKKIYHFEAVALAKYIHKQLVANEGTIPIPCPPKNPLTNQDFSLVQTIAILAQCRALGHTSWALESFVACRYDLDSFLIFHRKPLRIHALRTTMAKVEDWDAIDTLYDFIKTQFDVHNAAFPRTLYKWAVRHATDHSQIERWRKLCLKWYEVYILIDDPLTRIDMLATIQEKTLDLCSKVRELQTYRLLDGGRSP